MRYKVHNLIISFHQITLYGWILRALRISSLISQVSSYHSSLTSHFTSGISSLIQQHKIVTHSTGIISSPISQISSHHSFHRYYFITHHSFNRYHLIIHFTGIMASLVHICHSSHHVRQLLLVYDYMIVQQYSMRHVLISYRRRQFNLQLFRVILTLLMPPIPSDS